MTKSSPDDSTPANFCSHCGYPLRAAAEQRGDLVSFGPASAAFCCNCGAALDAAGRCPNSPDRCKFGGFTPHCS